MTHSCGNCGKPIASGDVTCPHCGALLAAWATPPEAGQSASYESPEYARPPEDTHPIRSDVFDSATATLEIRSPAQEVAHYPKVLTADERETASRLVNLISTTEKEAASRLVNTIAAYARSRELQARVSAPASRPRRNTESSTPPLRQRRTESSISNVAFGVGAVFVVVLVIMWGIVATMFVTNMVSLVFVVTTVVLTLAFRPTFNQIRRAL